MSSSSQTFIALPLSSLQMSSQSSDKSLAPISAYLLKQSAGKWKRKRWNQRWFVLDRKNGILRYFRYASPLESVSSRQDAHGVLSLKQTGVSLVVQGDLPPGVPTPFCFTVLAEGQQEIRLCADTKAEFRQWTTAISAVISPSRAGLRVGETKVAPTRMASPLSPSLAADVSSSLQLPTVKEKVVETKDLTAQNGRKEIAPKQVMKQMYNWVGSNKNVLLALNPFIVLVQFGSVSAWCFVVLLTNVTCVWLLWFRKPEPHVSSRTTSRPRAIVTHEMLSPASSTGFTSGSEVSRETSSSKLGSGSVTSQTSATTSDDQLPKRATFLGKINGVKTSAGASLKMCAAEIVSGCWMHVDATHFNVRQGPNYRKTKLKAASAPALLELVAVDVYQSDVKADNIGSIVDLSVLKPTTGNLDLFIVNCQVPSYQPSNPLWGDKQGDGAGFNFVTYFAIPPAVREMLNRPGEPPLQAVRLLKSFVEGQTWVSERFKAIGIVVNPQEQQLGRAECRLLETYNGQPILTRPQHKFYRGDGYFEVDVNAHEFNYIARKGLVGVSTHACNMIVDFGFVLEGQEDHELPEQMLGCVRLCKVDVRKAPRLL
ncbi:unnamed protein product [Peronospora farinosa]|uniref:PH domain-containing protein n=1 Tax=Peronospora farinosa TaxID=134698 RepID=A0AAV0U2F0_9STRA|nr:unnamed protein product [Peronospora farinosa]CAI5731060.1 unnamed protein product [Peronospora farinosa]